ncbi:NADH-quinone oxidoreductase subunit NuoK [Campylobacter novaezeelandiae]|uniref:NADH-quinone oxidoreductase subunit K n=1 Tax=Campylobacter novaezeelandiae TaxID=2267891 RepID=A0A4Q9JWG5_9BACT|nr:NADH-quinone oxidoreductase subunit NuoK [Campylobacter novaezeelandiae]MBK1964132.1 NADH-quinone oxidoreductase subunit NuoK [Campylobacter novaezeelandiae]MBK1993174.1 NADH-quinone oxidoreductase subunit NuoK [Campylobacter novaezeelandiae]QWU79563.1 NADH:quinone oxidoreductase I, membrane subunit K [Campylobacter novaezeelandiae]TBR79592.1 NADH-quinone oxidoreductase subunit NuoK [Campylobacter novaezeelandiae]TBR82465.1 NADH-quinone oxidoreductase subunit NuoK [Campylobacter novaezeelan
MIEKYFIVAILMFVIGLIGILKRQNLIMLFISTEILLNAANLILIAASKMHNDLNGQVFALFIMGVAACEVAVGVAFCVLWYRKKGSLELKSLKEIEV